MKDYFCKYCYNLGFSTYTTHNLRETIEDEIRIVCPILNKTKCNYCKDIGHTVSYCPLIKKLESKKLLEAKIEYNKLESSIYAIKGQ